jgi:hypothetical protein
MAPSRSQTRLGGRSVLPPQALPSPVRPRPLSRSFALCVPWLLATKRASGPHPSSHPRSPSFVLVHPCLSSFARLSSFALARLARWRRRGHLALTLLPTLVHPCLSSFALVCPRSPVCHRSPSLASLAGDEEGRLSPAASLAASGSGFSRLFLSRVCHSFVSHRFVLMPFPALSQVHDGPLSLSNTSGGVDLAATAARRRSSLFCLSFLSLLGLSCLC